MMNIVATDALVDLTAIDNRMWLVPSPMNVVPFLFTHISSVLILSNPMAKACSFPSAMIATTDSFGRSVSILAPFDVKPGHIIFAPDKTNLIAPRST